MIRETRRTFPFVAVFPQCTEGGSWSGNGPDAERALAILDVVSWEFPADPDLGSGGLYDVGQQEWRVADDPVVQRSIRRHDWNDFRVRITPSGIDAWINGRAALS